MFPDITTSFGIQIAVAAGATVIATSSSDEKLAIAKKLGAKHVINYSKEKNWDEEVLKIVCSPPSLVTPVPILTKAGC